MSVDFTGLIPFGWHGGEAVTKWWRGKFIHLYRLRKPCAQCQKEMVLDVTKAAIMGQAKNAGLHLVRCQACRERTPRDVTSRPTVLPTSADAPEPITPTAAKNMSDELQALRSWQAIVKEEVAELDALRKENYELKIRFGLIKPLRPANGPPRSQDELRPTEPAPKTVLIEGGFRAHKNKSPWD